MKNSPKVLLALTLGTILTAGASFAVAQEAEQTAPAPEEVVAAETVETLEEPIVEIYTRDDSEEAVLDSEAATPETMKIVEDVKDDVDANKIDAASETEIPAIDAEPIAEEEVQPEE